MKKENFATLILAVAGGIPFALGMCMCMVAQWGAFRQGLLVPGIAVGVLGIVLLLSLIPVCRGLR